MIIYNVTVKVGLETVPDWRNWMRTVHIPEVMNTGCFKKYNFCKIIEEDEDAETFAIQYFSESMETFLKYQQVFAAKLQKDHMQRYEGKYVAFRTLLSLEHSEEI